MTGKGARVLPLDTGEGLIVFVSMAKKQKESVSGRVVHLIISKDDMMTWEGGCLK